MKRVQIAVESIGSLVLESTGPVSGVVPTTLDFASLVEQYADFVFRSLRRAGLDAATSEDAAQQVFLVASRKLHDITAGKERAFLYRTAMNVAGELRRRASKRAEVELDEEGATTRAARRVARRRRSKRCSTSSARERSCWRSSTRCQRLFVTSSSCASSRS
ncbi:RNA polymerase sigma factor RpoE [Labilithrix luteola]|uniref:RNA polymerase sigma factor RpoE n=1 Tax=Labilithrix luteola TaxID=1391654 RepID=A0A0K1Q307_9BACT|nr:sigma factor [Labilithrix luteola]AKV00201.1 RNA polymerase sigma factor RpoE [Labilithrix luteola]